MCPVLVTSGRVVECVLNCARNAFACNAIQRGACVGRRMKRLSSKQEEQFLGVKQDLCCDFKTSSTGEKIT